MNPVFDSLGMMGVKVQTSGRHMLGNNILMKKKPANWFFFQAFNGQAIKKYSTLLLPSKHWNYENKQSVIESRVHFPVKVGDWKNPLKTIGKLHSDGQSYQ